jgi:hypothetical protein
MSKFVPIARYRVTGDSGQQYEVIEYDRQFDHLTGGQSRSYSEGRSWRLADGSPVNYNRSDDTFKIVQTDEVLRKIP